MVLHWSEIEALAGEGASRAEEIEDASRLPADLLKRLQTSGALRMTLGPEFGGWSATPAEMVRAAVRVAAGDGSLGWIMAASAAFNPILLATADRRFTDEFFSDPFAVLAGGIAGSGTAVPVEGGFEVEGSWTFASGCWDASWLCGFCILNDNGGPPRLVMVVIPADRGRLEASWDVVGLRGTSSDTVVIPRQVVPPHWLIEYPAPLDRELPEAGPLSSYGRGLWPTATAAAAVQLGVARRALDEAVAFGQTKRRPLTPGPLISEQAFQRELFTAEAAWQSAYDGLSTRLDQLWQQPEAGEPIDLQARLGARLAASHAAHEGARIVRTCFDLAGAGAVGRLHPLARCHRDGTILNHHATVNSRTFDLLARVSLGQEPDSPFV